jgi:hypothetical protein
MSGFENFAAEAAQLDLELQRKGIALDIEWANRVQVRELARAALDCKPAEIDCGLSDPQQSARFALFGIAHMMLQLMRESAEFDIHTHGGPTWKAFARELWAEHESREALAKVGDGDTA